MRIEDYPAQEPLSDFARAYHEKVMARGKGIAAIEVQIGDDPYQSLALHVPSHPNGLVLGFMHGGGWTNGYKEWMAFMAPPLLKAGVLFASIGYRLAPAHVFPAGYEDVQSAVKWLYENAARHGGDRAKIFVGGHSAGGHYAALLAASRDWQKAQSLPDQVIRGCMPISGVFDFGSASGLSARPRFLGESGNEVAASPIKNIANQPPPFLLAYGADDFPHLKRQALDMETALGANGGRVTRFAMPGRDHLSASYAAAEEDGPWLSRALEWMATI